MMDKHLWLELLGYAASLLVAISVMMSSVLRLRIINLIGAAGFALYGLFIHAYPVAVMNAFIVGVNAFYLVRMLGAKEYFRLLTLRPDSDYLRYFLAFYAKDILRVLPDFEYRPAPKQITLFILRNCSPAGVFIAEELPDGVLRVVLDFVIPRYRDLKIGRFLFVEQASYFRERGIREIVVSPRTEDFGAYLLKVGFQAARGAEPSFRIVYEAEPGAK